MTLRRWLAGLFALVAVVVILLAGCGYFLLWEPSLRGYCGDPHTPTLYLRQLRGQVVGRNLGIIQYRWLRRRFNAVGTALTVERTLPSTEYKGNEIQHSERVWQTIIDRSGRFDSGDLTSGDYLMTVKYPGEDGVGFRFVIDASAQTSEVLIDASPAYYCKCCGWDFEPR